MRSVLSLLFVFGIVLSEEVEIQVEDIKTFNFPVYGNGYVPGSNNLSCDEFSYQAPDDDICLSASGNVFSTFLNCEAIACDMVISIGEEGIVLLLNYSRAGSQCKDTTASCSAESEVEQGTEEIETEEEGPSGETPNSNEVDNTLSKNVVVEESDNPETDFSVSFGREEGEVVGGGPNPTEKESKTRNTEFSVSLGAELEDLVESGDGGFNPTEGESSTSRVEEEDSAGSGNGRSNPANEKSRREYTEFSVNLPDDSSAESSGDGENSRSLETVNTAKSGVLQNAENSAREESGSGAPAEEAVNSRNIALAENEEGSVEQSGEGVRTEETQFSVSFNEEVSSMEETSRKRVTGEYSVSFDKKESSRNEIYQARKRRRVKRDEESESAGQQRPCQCQTTWCLETINTAYERNGKMYIGNVTVKYPCGCDCRRRSVEQLISV